jgi:ubiquinone/menaquinone biosynthesis C-methylase UbiE
LEILFAKNHNEFLRKTILYREEIQPFLQEVELRIGKTDPTLLHPSIAEYLTYMKWPIRQLEYSFALENALPVLNHKKGVKSFDAGCGVTLLAPFFSKLGCMAYGGDFDRDTIENMKKVGEFIYGSKVHYSFQNLASLTLEDDTFDIITCISVLEHMESPDDTKAVGEMLRVLKPDGKLIITVDFAPGEKWTEKWLRRICKVMSYAIKRQFQTIMSQYREYREKQEIESQVSDGTRKSDQAYNLQYINKNLVEPFKSHFNSRIIQRTWIAKSKIKNFWRQYWYEGCLYEQDSSKSYISLGFILSK